MQHTIALNLNLFDEGAATDGLAQPGAAINENPADAGQGHGRDQDFAQAGHDKSVENAAMRGEKRDAAAGQEQPVDKKSAFEAMIKGDFKTEFDQRVQGIINERFREMKTLQEQYEKVKPTLEWIASRYGIDPADVQALEQTIGAQSPASELETLDNGLTPEQQQELDALQQEQRERQLLKEQEERIDRANQIYQDWMQQAEILPQIYPQFVLEAEMENPVFAGLVRNGIDLRTAYEVVHKDDILGGAMQYTAQTVAQKLSSNVQARARRPMENGASGQGASRKGIDVNLLTKDEIQDIIWRVGKGETITF